MKPDDFLLISVGGGASKIAQRVVESVMSPVRALLLDTDDAMMQEVMPVNGISTAIFGAKRLDGRGTGGDCRLGASALRDDIVTIQAQIGTPRLVVVLTCCGGGTSGATQVLLEMLRNQGIATLTFATTPFTFEGTDRKRAATIVLPTLESCSDALVRIPLDTLLDESNRQLSTEEAFAVVAERLAIGAGLIWMLVAHPAFVAFDVERFRIFLTENATGALPFTFVDATASGSERTKEVLRKILNSKRLRSDGVDRLANASQVIVGVLAGSDLRLAELDELMSQIRKGCPAAKEVILGTANIPELEGKLSVVVLAFAPAFIDIDSKADEGFRPIGNGRRNSKGGRNTAQLGMAKDRFSDVERTIYNGQDLDTPTFQRRGIRLAR